MNCAKRFVFYNLVVLIMQFCHTKHIEQIKGTMTIVLSVVL